MEPEDLPWLGELEEEEEEEDGEVLENELGAATEGAEEARTSEETTGMEEFDEGEPEVDLDFNCESQPLESTDEEEDEMAKAWLEAQPVQATRLLLPPPPPRHLYRDKTKGAESWHCLPQERDSSKTVDTYQTGTSRREGTEEIQFSLEEGELAQSQHPVKELFCSPLQMIQDNFAAPDLPLLTCLTQDKELEPDSLFQQNELEFTPLRGISDKSEDTEWLSRPSEVSEALIQATSETSSDLFNSCLSISQHPLTGSTTFGSQRSLFLSEQENNGGIVPPNARDELKSLNDSDHYDALYSYMSWQTEKDTQQPEGNLAEKDLVSISALSDVSDESIAAKRKDSFDASCSCVQYWGLEALQHTETCLVSEDHASFPFEITPPPNKMSYSFLRSVLERRKASLTSVHHLENVCLRASAKDEMSQKNDVLEGYERNGDMQKELSQFFKQKESRNSLPFSQVHVKSPEIKYTGMVTIRDSHEQVSEANILSRRLHTSELEGSSGPLQTVKSNLDDTSEQRYFQEERNENAASTFGEKNVGATENVAFEAVIASIEPSKQESPINEIQTDNNKPLADDSQERESPKPDLSQLNCNDENSFIDKLKRPKFQSTPGVFESAASKLFLDKEDDTSSLYGHPNLSPPNALQDMLSKPISVIPELKLSTLNEKAYSQAVGLEQTQSALFQCSLNNLNLTEKVGPSKIIFAMKLSTSDSWVLQDLKLQTFEEVADSSDFNLESLQGKAESAVFTLCGDAEYSSLYGNPGVYNERIAELQREVDRSNLAISEPFPSTLPSFVSQEPSSESECHSSNLRMLRVSPDTLPATLTRSTGDISKGSKASITHSKLKSDITDTLGDSDIGTHFSLPLEDFNGFAQVVPEGSLSEEALKGSVHLGLATPNTGVSPVSSSSYSQRENPSLSYQEGLPDGYEFGQELTVSAFPGQADQKNGFSVVTPTLYSQREKPGIFYQQARTGGYLPEETTEAPAAPRLGDQKSSFSTVTSYLQSNKPGVSYDQTFTSSHLPEDTVKSSAAPRLGDQKSSFPTITSSYLQSDKPGVSYEQTLTSSHLPEDIRSSSAPRLGDQKSSFSTVTSSYLQSDKPGVSYEQTLTSSHLPEDTVKSSAAPRLGDQKSSFPTVTSYLQSDKPGVSYEQTLTSSHLPEDIIKSSSAPRQTDQKYDVPASASTGTYTDFYQQELPENHLSEESTQGLSLPVSPVQNIGITALPSTSHSQGEKPHTFYHQALPESYLSHQAFKTSKSPDELSGMSALTSASYSYKERPSISHQQKFPDSHLTEETQKVSGTTGSVDLKTVTQTVSSTSGSSKETPSILYQQALPGGLLPGESLKVSAAPRPPDQSTGASTVSPSSYPPTEESIIFYQPGLPGNPLSTESFKVPGISAPTEQRTGTPAGPFGSYPVGEKPIIFYQQALPEEILQASAAPGSSAQNTTTSAISSSSYPTGQEPLIFYQPGLLDSPVTAEKLKVEAFSGSAKQKTDISARPSSSLAVGVREKSIIFYQQALSDGHLPTEVSAGPADQKSGEPSVYSTSYSFREKPIIIYRQSASQLTEEGHKASVASGPTDEKSGPPVITSFPYSNPEYEKVQNASYHQELPYSHLTENTKKGSVVPGTTDHKTGILTPPSTSHLSREKPTISYQQEVPDLSEKALKVLGGVRPTAQKTETPIVSSVPLLRERPSVSYQQDLPDLTEEALQILGVPGVVPSVSYSHDETPLISYKQELADLTEISLKAAGSGSTDQKMGSQVVSHSSREKLSGFHQQKLPNTGRAAVDAFVHPGPAVQKAEKPTEPLSYYPQTEASALSPQELLASHLTEEAGKASAGSVHSAQTPGTPTGSSSSYVHREKFIDFYPKASSDHNPTENSLKASTILELSDQNRRSSISFGSYSHKDISVADPQDQNTVSPTVTHRFYIHREKPAVSTVNRPDDQKTPVPTAVHDSYAEKVKPVNIVQKQLPDRDQSGDIPKISTVSEPTVVSTASPAPLSGYYSHREESDTFYPQELLDRHLTEDSLKVSSGLGQADQISGSSTVSFGTYSHSENHQVVSEHVQKLIDHLNSPESCLNTNSIPLNSQIDDGVTMCKPESSGFGDVGYEEIRDIDPGSKTLKEIRTLLMEAENIALKRCNFPAPLVPFRDVNDVSFIQSKKVVCFKEPPTTDVRAQRGLFTEEAPHVEYEQKDIGTQTNLMCQRGVENWEFISSTTIRSPLQEAEGTARVSFDETFRPYDAARSVMRSEPEGYRTGIGNKIIIPMMTIIKSDSSSDVSDGCYSWDSNLPETLESVSDVFLNFIPYTSTKTSIPDSREEEGLSESEDYCGSVDSLGAHVKYLLQCESSLNQAKQILKNAEEEECRVRAQARAWNLKLNLERDYGYSISELNEDDRRKVEEIKAKLFGHGRATHLSEGLQSPRGIGCVPEAVCSHIVIESHGKECFRTLTAEQPRPDSRRCVFRSVEPADLIRGQRSPPSWRGRHINLSRSIDQSNSHFKVWNSFQLQNHSPFQKLAPSDIKISKGLGMSFHANMDSQPSGLVEPTCVPAKEMDFPSSSQMLPPDPKKQFTTSITFSSHVHSKCISSPSVFKVDVTAGSQSIGPSASGVFKPHIPEEHISPRTLKQKTFFPSSLKRHSHSPVTVGSRQGQNLPLGFEHFHQKEELLEKSDFKVSRSESCVNTNYSSFRGVQFSGKDTIINQDKLSPTLEVKEKNVTITPDLPSCIFLEQRELFEQSKAPHVDHEIREDLSFFPKCQDYIVADLPPDFLDEQQCDAPDVDGHMRTQQYPLSQGQDCSVEKIEHIPQSYFPNMVNIEAKISNISQSAPDHCTDPCSPSNRKALSCVRITLCPKTSSKLDSGTLDERFHSLDPASKTRTNSECNADLRIISSRSLEPTSKLLTCKPVAQDQESLDFLGPKSPLDLQVTQSSLPDSKTIFQDLKAKTSQTSQIVTSRQTQVNISDLEEYSKPEGTPVSADGLQEQNKAPFLTSSGKLSSDAVTQITTESPGKTTFSSEIFINADDHGQEVLGPVVQKLSKFASSSSVQQITASHDKDVQPQVLPYKPSDTSRMYYVQQLETVPSYLDSKSDTTVESSHSGSNDAVAPDFPPQVLGTRDDDLSGTVNIRHTEGIYSKRTAAKGKTPSQKEAPVQVSVTGDETVSDRKQKELISRGVVIKMARPEERTSLQKDPAGCSSSTVQVRKTKNLPDTKSTKQKEEIHVKRTISQERCLEDRSLEIDISDSECHSAFENTTHSVFRSAKFYFHHPVHLPYEQDLCHESSGRSVFMQHSWKDFFHHHSEHSCLPPSDPCVDKTKMDYTRIKSLSINLNLGDNEKMHTVKPQAKDPKGKRQTDDQKKDQKVIPELTTQCTTNLNELWNKYQERQKQQKPPGVCEKKELSLVERLDRLAKMLQNPITHSLHTSESTQDESRRDQGVRGWTGKRQQKSKQQRKWCKSEEWGQNAGEPRKSRVLSPYPTGKSSQIKIERIKLDKYILRKQPDFNYVSNTSSDSRPSEDSEFLTDSPNIFSSTTSPVDSDVLTQTDRDVTLNERSSSISTIDTARLIQAFGHERLYLSPRRIKLYNSVTDQQRRNLQAQCKNSRMAVNTGCPQMTSENPRRKHIQVPNPMISSDSVSTAGSFLSLDSTLSNEENVHMLNKGVQAGKLEIVTGAKKHTRDVGVTFPSPASGEARLEEDSGVTSWPIEKAKEKKFLTHYLRARNLGKKQPSPHEGVSWFVPVENVKSGSKKENLHKIYSPGISWFEPVTKTKPWREPLREQNWQEPCLMSHGVQGGSGGGGGSVSLRPFVRVTLQEALQFHRPDFISRSRERMKRLKLLVQERKLQNLLQSERESLFNTVQPLPRRVHLAIQKTKPIGKNEMIQRTKRIYEQLPEVKKKREEEKRKSDYKSYRLRAQLYKMRITNQLLGRKVPWD
ncbi:centrosome-associated protein ALMS1 [Psammomys obesus]|uniref:centrosome-associated protein ALMS1 n=1 Tax=Psammomys obesus TaxID=48139 RepID=UPI0024532241|nr:centrosome-associated protein ALMS1 [Psammomys obesus]